MGSSFDLSKIIPTPASVADTIIGIRQNNYNAHFQEEMLAKNQEFNAAEAEKSRVFSQNERIAQQEYNTQERLAAQKYNTQERLAVQDYNSISNQVNQLKSEGVNPAVYFSGSSGRFSASTPASSTGATSSIPSAATASSSGMPSPVMGIPQLASGMADIMNAMTNANIGEHSVNLMDANVEKVLAEAFDTQQAGFLKQLQYDINRAEFPYRLKKMMTDIVVLEGLKVLQEKEGKKFDRESDLLDLKQATEKAIAKLKGNEALTAEVYYNKCGKIWDSQITANKAAADASSASARSSNASADYQEIINKIYNDKDVRDSIAIDLMQAAVNANKEGKIKDAQVRVIQHSADMLKKATDNYEIQMWSNIFNQSIQTVTDALGTYAKNKISKEYIDAIKNRPQPSYTRDAYGGPGYFNYPSR